MRLFRHQTAFLALLLPLVLGCQLSGGSPMAPTKISQDATLPSGWVRVRSTDAPLSIGMPSGWSSQTISADQFQKNLNAASRNDPRLQRFSSSATDEASQNRYRLLLRNKGVSGKAGGVCVLIDSPHNASVSLEQIAAASEKALSGDGVHMSTSQENLPAGHCIVHRYTAPSQRSGPQDHVNYMFVSGDHYYLLSFRLPPGDSTAAAVAAKMAKTFEIGR